VPQGRDRLPHRRRGHVIEGCRLHLDVRSPLLTATPDHNRLQGHFTDRPMPLGAPSPTGNGSTTTTAPKRSQSSAESFFASRFIAVRPPGPRRAPHPTPSDRGVPGRGASHRGNAPPFFRFGCDEWRLGTTPLWNAHLCLVSPNHRLHAAEPLRQAGGFARDVSLLPRDPIGAATDPRRSAPSCRATQPNASRHRVTALTRQLDEIAVRGDRCAHHPRGPLQVDEALNRVIQSPGGLVPPLLAQWALVGPW